LTLHRSLGNKIVWVVSAWRPSDVIVTVQPDMVRPKRFTAARAFDTIRLIGSLHTAHPGLPRRRSAPDPIDPHRLGGRRPSSHTAVAGAKIAAIGSIPDHGWAPTGISEVLAGGKCGAKRWLKQI